MLKRMIERSLARLEQEIEQVGADREHYLNYLLGQQTAYRRVLRLMETTET